MAWGNSWGRVVQAIAGRIPRSWPTKKVLITVDGTRYLVPWDKIDSFLSLAQDDVAKKATAVAKKATKKRAPPKIIIKEAPPEIRAAVQLAVDRTNEQIRTLWYRALEIALRERDDEEALLLLA